MQRLDQHGQSAWTVVGALLSFLVAAAVGFFVERDNRASGAASVGDGVALIVSLLLLLVGAYLVLVFTQQVLQSYYTREIGRRLYRLEGELRTEPSSQHLYGEPSDEILLGLETMLASYDSTARGVREARYVYRSLVTILAATIVTVIVVNVWTIEDGLLRALMIAASVVVLTLGIRLGYRSTVRGRELWR